MILKRVLTVSLFAVAIYWGQASATVQPPVTNVPNAEYPRVD